MTRKTKAESRIFEAAPETASDLTATAGEQRAVLAVPNGARGADVVILLPDADIESRRVKR